MDKAFAIRDLRRAIAQNPVDLVCNGATVQGTRSRLDAKSLASAAGLQGSYQLSVQCVAADWIVDGADKTPAHGAVLNVGGQDFRVLRSMLDSLGVGLRLDLGAKYEP